MFFPYFPCEFALSKFPIVKWLSQYPNVPPGVGWDERPIGRFLGYVLTDHSATADCTIALNTSL